MIPKQKPKGRWHLHTSPWAIIGSVIILLIVVVVFAAQNYSREKQYMSRILAEKGAVIAKAVEAGARTGMMGMMWGGSQVQKLIEETAQLPGVLYITVTNRDGLVQASSNRELVGTRLAGLLVPGVQPSETISWRFKDIGNQQQSFEVSRAFTLITGQTGGMHHQSSATMSQCDDWCSARGEGEGEKVILVGLDPKPFQDAAREDIRNTAIISGVLIVLGMAGFISMFWLQSYRTTQRSLQDTSAIADQVVKSLPVGLVATDKDGKISIYNKAAERITGLDLKNARGNEPASIMPANFCGLREYLDRGESISEKEMECEFTADKIVPISISASSIVNEEGTFVGQVLILRDLGEIRRLEEEVRRKEKLAAIGGLAAGVAHEIRNPLSSIKGIASYYKSKFTDGSEDKEMAEVMIEEVDRLGRVISQLLEFARPAELNLRPANLNEILEHSARLVKQEAIAKNIQIDLNLSPKGEPVLADPDRLTQCFLNLYLNGLQAMENGGRLIISSFIRNGGFAVDIKDSGSGISADDLTKIFDPYFTTKTKGTGLGLAIVHKIVEAHQGQVKVRSTIGQGTVFSIILPLRPTR
ncbi:MAG: ATP-binding protein [Desulforhopalus sp.]|nr:ATP-binding protein [Desulforhopalus sp.]